jgi:hypothetical protein
MFSLKSTLAARGLIGPYSVARDVFGFQRARVPLRPDLSDATVSLLAWAKLKKSESFNVNIVAVGADQFTNAMWDEVDTAVHRLSEVWGPIGIGVKWVDHVFVSTANAQGLDMITSEYEIDTLLDTWYVDNDGIELYFPAVWNVQIPQSDGTTTVVLGASPTPGPCHDEKNGKGPNGVSVGLAGRKKSSRTCAHEVGHYLGLEHQNYYSWNLMAQSKFAVEPKWQQVALTSGQDATATAHCMVGK